MAKDRAIQTKPKEHLGTACNAKHSYSLMRVAIRATLFMIISFRHKGLKQFFLHNTQNGIAPVHAVKLRLILTLLNAAAGPEDVIFPGAKLHPLKGFLLGHWSIWVDAHWRVTFRFIGEDVELVDYQDYH